MRMMAAVFLVLLVLPAELPANTDDSSEVMEKSGKVKKRFRIDAEVRAEYNDNIFRLDDSKTARMKENDSEDRQSGRFQDMDSIYDYIVSPEMRLNYRSPSPLGGKLQGIFRFRYNLYLLNEKSSHPEGKIELRHTVGKNGRLSLGSEFLFGHFRRNYLCAVNDANGNGNISRDERIYSSAIYDEIDTLLAYQHRLHKRKKNTDHWLQLPGISVQPLIGCRFRRYNDCFENRNRDVLIGGAEVALDLSRRVDLELRYRYEKVFCPGNAETVLIDETPSGMNMDLNGDGLFKEDAPVFTEVDRSRNQHVVRLQATIALAKNWRGFLGYRLRKLRYTSDNPWDIYYGQKETRQGINVGMRWRFLKDWLGTVEYKRTDDEEYEQNQFIRATQNSVICSVRYRFP